MTNQDVYLDFTNNPTLADALSDANVGEKVKVEMVLLVKSKDDKGLSAAIDPGSVVPEGYEPVEGGDDNDGDEPAAPPQPAAGSMQAQPVEVMQRIKKKGS